MPTVSRATLYRRFYLYAALSIAVASASVAAAVLLRTVLQVAGLGPRPLDADVSRAVSLSAAILAFALPVGAVHLVFILRGMRDPAERGSATRHGFLSLWIAVVLLAELFSGVSLVNVVVQSQNADPTPQLALMVVAALVGTIALSWAARTPPESPRARVRAAAIVLLVAMLVAVAFLGNAASAAGDLYASAAGVRPQAAFGQPVERTLRTALLSVGVALVVWAAAFAWQWRWRAMRDRLAYGLALYGAGVLALAVGVALEISGAIRHGRDPREVFAFTGAWPALAVGVLLVSIHGGLLLADRGRNGHPAVVGTRFLLAFPALVGLGALIAGLSNAWRAAVEGGQQAESDLAVAAGFMVVGLVAYPLPWLAFVRRSGPESAVRRFYLFSVVCLALVAAIGSGVRALYELIVTLAGTGDAESGRDALVWAAPAVLLAVVFVTHLWLLLRDQRRTRAAERVVEADALVALLEDVRAGRRSVAEAANMLRAGGSSL